MGRRETIWAWGHPRAQQGDRMKLPGNGFASVEIREEGSEGVRFCVIPEGERPSIPQWTGWFGKSFSTGVRSSS